jgi:hypothetical protein
MVKRGERDQGLELMREGYATVVKYFGEDHERSVAIRKRIEEMQSFGDGESD